MLAAAQRHNSLFTFASTPPSIRIVVASDGHLSLTPLSKFKVLLCDCFVAVKKSEFLDKLSPRRVRAIHLGYDFVYILELQQITTVSDIAFDEKNFTVLGTLRPETRLLRRAHNTELPTSATPARAPTASELPTGMEILDLICNPASPIEDSTTTTAAAVASTIDETGTPAFLNCVPP